MISLSSGRGDRFMTLHTVRNNVDQASLWNTMTMDVVGSLDAYDFNLQLKLK